MQEQAITIKTVELNNNCPECFSKEGLQLTFKQQFKETLFYKSLTQNVSTVLHCNLCNTTIYPARWTDDIERVYDYQMKAFTPKKEAKKYKALFWIILVIIALIISAIVYVITQTDLTN